MTRFFFLLLLFLVTLTPAPAAPPARFPAAQKLLDERLIAAAESGEPETVKALLKRGAHVNYEDKDGDTALHLAVYWGRADVLRLLLAHGASVKDWRLLFNAENKIAELLFARGADADERGPDGETALMDAANADSEGGAVSSPDKIKLLLRHGADVNAKTKTGETALMRAAAFTKPSKFCSTRARTSTPKPSTAEPPSCAPPTPTFSTTSATTMATELITPKPPDCC